MEQIVTWQSPKKIGIFVGSLLLLFGLLNITSIVRSPVTFPDPNFEAVIRDRLGKDTGLIYEEELLSITELDASSQGISHIDGIEYLSRLVFLNLADNAVEDLSPLAELSILTELDLRNNPIADLDAVNFAAITHLPLRELDLSNDVGRHHPRLTDISLLGNLTQLESLDLRGNHVGDLSPLAELRSLTELNLRDNRISDLAGVNFAAITHLPLRHLNLRDNVAESGERLSDIAPLAGLAQLETLNLRDNHIQDPAPLSSLGSLSSLNLRGNQVADLEPLKPLTALNELNLRENGLTDLAPLSALTNLEYLNIHSNPVNAGFEALTNLPGLHTLIMRNVALGEHVVYLDNLASLQRLNLRNTGIANTQPLGFMRQLELLDLRDNFINDISAFSTLTSLKALDLANNQVSDIQALRPLTNMQDLNLSGNAVADIAPLAGMTDLADLNLDGNPTVTGFEALGNLEQLQTLNLSNAALGTNVNDLANLTSLEHLNLRNTGIPSVVPLAEMTELQTLDLRANHINDITALTTLIHLQELDLRDNHVFDIAPLGELHDLQLLNLRGNTVGDLAPLGGLTNLAYLNVHSNPVESGVEALANLSALDTLILRDVWLGADVAVLENLTQVVRLNLRNTGITDVQPLTGMVGLVELDLGENNLQDLTALAALTNLTALDLPANQVGDLTPLQNLVHLQTLNLDGNAVRDLTPLAGLSALTELSLADNQISRLGAVNFDEISHLPLTHLNLGDNAAGQQPSLVDLDLLGGLTRLTELDLRGNQLSDLTPLSSLTSLRVLDLRRNQVADLTPLQSLTALGALNLAENQVADLAPLAELTALTELDLSRNQVAELAAVNFDTITRLPLAHLNLCHNADQAGNQLADITLLGQLTGLTSLALRGNQIGDLSPLGGLTGLQALDLRENQVVDLAPLQNLTALEKLNLRENQVANLQPLEALSRLVYLNAHSNPINAGLAVLGSFPRLESLILRNVALGDDVIHLANLANLTYLNLRSTGITDLAPLEGHTRLSHADLRSNAIESIDPLRSTYALQVLDLRENQVESIEPLRHLYALESLNLRENAVEDLDPLAGLIRLEYLNLHSNGFLAGEDALANLVKLEALIMRNTSVVSHAFLSELTRLHRLNLRNAFVSDLRPLAGLTQLTDLDLRDNTISDVTPLAALTHLGHLDLRRNQVTDISPLGGLGSLVALDLRENQIEDINALTGMGGLTYLNLRENQIEDIGALGGINNLTYLNLHSNPVEGGFEALAGLTGLQTLLMRDVELGEGVQYVAGLRDLTRLNLTNSSISDVTALANLSALETLGLRDNDVRDIEPLAGITQLAVLDLRQNRVTDIEPLRTLTNLTELNIRENRVTDLASLEGLTNLAYLNLHSNPVEAGLPALANLGQLEALIMRNVTIGDDFGFLSSLTGLQRLNIRNSDISDVSVIADLMAAGALQDDPHAGRTAVIDLLQIDPASSAGDPYLGLRRFWDNITYRFPITLPYYPSHVAGPAFSHESGFYHEGFELEITTQEPGGRIFYTLDGSPPALTPDLQPMAGTYEYTSPLQLELDDDLLRQNSNVDVITSATRHHAPPGDIFRAYVIRALVIDGQGQRGNVSTQTFFLDRLMDQRYTMPIVSIVTDSSGFFEDELGIYVLGDLYENLHPDNPTRNPANFKQRGLKWERPASLQMFDPAGMTLIDHDVGIRIHGAWTRAWQQKSLRVYARGDYDYHDHIHFNFFSELDDRVGNWRVEVFETLLLRNSGNDWDWTMFRDAMAHSLLEHTQLDIQGYQPAIVLINGEYWGIHNIRTRFDEGYFETYYGIDSEELTVLRGGLFWTYRGNHAGRAEFFELLRMIDPNFEDNNYRTVDALADQTLYEDIATRIDVENFVLHYLAQIYFSNHDWPQNNNPFWRKLVDPLTVDPEVPHGHDGKWRWMINDVDHGFRDVDQNVLIHATRDDLPTTFLMRALLQNEGFRTQFINTFADHLNTTFYEDVVVEHINAFEALYYPEIEEHIQRWGASGGTLDGWARKVDEVREFALLRPAIQRQQIIEYFDLPGMSALTTTADPAQGYIRINSIDIQPGAVGVENPNLWQGIYFQGVPIEVTAIPQPGYRFVRWLGLEGLGLDPTSASLVFELPEDIRLTAVFERE